VLSALLYRGWRIADDHVMARPRIEWPSVQTSTNLGCQVAAGCGEATAATAILLVTLLAAWLFTHLVWSI
jgi:hypothetical protein